MKTPIAPLLLSLATLAFVSACNRLPADAPPASQGSAADRKLTIPEHGIYTGAYMGFGDREDDVSLDKIEAFESMVGKRQAIIASSSYWGEQTFPDANVRLIARHGAVPLIFWSPWDRPYTEGRGPDKYSLTSIVDGTHDAYIDRWADQARSVGSPIIVSFGNEMNGEWFPWSGKFYGGGTPIPDSNPPKFEGPETFKKAWRHIVDRFRARGASNVQWVFHAMDFSAPNDEWNLVEQYYPGSDYVDWLGFSLYGSQFPSDESYPDFFSCFDWPYTELCQLDPQKPVMLCEWGVGEFPAKGDKGEWIRGAWRTMQNAAKYPRLKAAVFWNERWQNGADTGLADMNENAGKYSDLRVNSSPGSLRAYREGLASAFFLPAPQFR